MVGLAQPEAFKACCWLPCCEQNAPPPLCHVWVSVISACCVVTSRAGSKQNGTKQKALHVTCESDKIIVPVDLDSVTRRLCRELIVRGGDVGGQKVSASQSARLFAVVCRAEEK